MRTRASSEAPSCPERSSSLWTISSFIPEESAKKDSWWLIIRIKPDDSFLLLLFPVSVVLKCFPPPSFLPSFFPPFLLSFLMRRVKRQRKSFLVLESWFLMMIEWKKESDSWFRSFPDSKQESSQRSFSQNVLRRSSSSSWTSKRGERAQNLVLCFFASSSSLPHSAPPFEEGRKGTISNNILFNFERNSSFFPSFFTLGMRGEKRKTRMIGRNN